MINKPPINVQDGFFYQLRKDNTLVDVVLLSERKRLGRIKRFDKYALVLDVDGREEMIYKHAIASGQPHPGRLNSRASRPSPESGAGSLTPGGASACPTQPPPPGAGGWSAAQSAAFTLALLAALAGGCTGAPAAAPGVPRTADGPFAYRDPRVGAPPPHLAARDAKALEAAVAALRRGDTSGMARALEGKRRKGAPPPPLELVAAYADLAEGNLEDAKASLAALVTAHPAWIAAVEADADLAAVQGRSADALERYRTLGRLVPHDERARERVEVLRSEVAAAKRQEAEAALGSGDPDAARRAHHSLLQLEPTSARRPRASRFRRGGGWPERRAPGPAAKEAQEGSGQTPPSRPSPRWTAAGRRPLGRRRQPARPSRRDRPRVRIEGTRRPGSSSRYRTCPRRPAGRRNRRA